MKTIIAAAMLLLTLATPSHATEDFCVKVKPTPDGFIVLRAKPTMRSARIGTLISGVILHGDTRGAYDTPEWTHVFIGEGDAWIATKYAGSVECRE